MKRKLKRRKETTEKLSRSVMRSLREREPDQPVEFISSGCTTLNLALSGKGKDGGWGRGRITNIVGDGSSGKTLLALEAAFWVWKNIKKVRSRIYKNVKDVEICYDNGEGVMDFPVAEMYGQEFYNAVNWDRSKHFEAMCRRFIRKAFALKRGQALLYIIDSWDSFQSAVSKKAFMESVKDDVDLKGDYDLAVQKYASRKFFPNFCDALDKNKMDATLIIISQVRTKIGVKFGKKQYRAGGKALDFYVHQAAWIREVERLTKTKKGEKRVYGIKSHVKVERSKIGKPFRESEFIILYDYGLDDINSIIDYIWGKKVIQFDGHKFKRREKFVKYIERNNLEDKLIEEAATLWNMVEAAFTKEVKRRKPRY